MQNLDFDSAELRKSFAERCVEDSATGCWNWTGPRFVRGGYACITCRPAGIAVMRAHRVAWQMKHGPIARDQHVLHRCDNRICVKPEHLFLGDQASNMDDKVAKGRQDRGESHGMHKLTEEQAKEIIRDTRYMREIAADYGVSIMTISDIKRGHSWQHLDRSDLFLRKAGFHAAAHQRNRAA